MKPSHGLKIDLPEPKKNERDFKDGWVYPTGRFDWIKPIALGWGEWDDWKLEMQKKYPVRYFIHESIPDIWSDVWEYGVVRFFHNLKWNILHRFHPKHRYHMVPTGLKPGYYDPDTLIFNATFTLLTEFVENNIKWDRVDWEGDDEGHRKAWAEMNDLVHWYKEIYPNREKLLDKARPEPRMNVRKMFGNDKDDKDPEVIAYRKYMDYYMKMEDQWAKDDETNLIRAIKLRPYLWYA